MRHFLLEPPDQAYRCGALREGSFHGIQCTVAALEALELRLVALDLGLDHPQAIGVGSQLGHCLGAPLRQLADERLHQRAEIVDAGAGGEQPLRHLHRTLTDGLVDLCDVMLEQLVGVHGGQPGIR